MEEISDGDLAATGEDVQIPVPSGQVVTLQDVIWNVPGPEGLALRFRFVAPEIAEGGRVDFDMAVNDIKALCQDYAVSRVSNFGPVPQQIIISLSEKPTPFGESAPDVKQFFEAFRIEDGTCIWELY
jgi:Family of unknown function (DUF6497)